MPRSASPVRDRTLPKVAGRLGLRHHQLLRAVRHGDVKVETWAGVQWITKAEEDRVGALLTELRSQDSEEPTPAKVKAAAAKSTPASKRSAVVT
jgi:hypothetical protein